MSATDVRSRVLAIVGAVLNVDASALDPVSPAETISTWDSMRHLQLVLAIEEAFGIQFAVEDIESMGTVGAVVEAVRRRVPAA